MDKRLTVKTDNGYALPLHFEGETTKHLEKIIQAYGKIEDIEEDYGIKLETLVKATQEGIKVKTKSGVKHFKGYMLFIDFNSLRLFQIEDNYVDLVESDFDFADYGELWVLESEDFR